MAHSEAVVQTNAASRYIVQLCKHWSHKFEVAYDPRQGRVVFGEARCDMRVEGAGLWVGIDAPEADLERMQGVVATHLNRFAHREGELAFDWRRSA